MVIRPSPRKAPAVTIRFRTKSELERIRRAARINGCSLNTFVSNAAVVDADQRIIADQERQAAKEGVSA